jgi:hypothetical protein
MRLSSLTGLLLLSFFTLKSQPTTWQPRGVGGGGVLFSPSINPAKTDEFFVACDLSAMFQPPAKKKKKSRQPSSGKQ